MISRVAENCFWMSRYLERVDTLSRVLDVNLAFVLDVDLPAPEEWRPLLIVTEEDEAFRKKLGNAAANDGEVVQEYLAWDRDSPCSVYESLRSARENARTIRETISLEMWETVNDLWTWMNGPAARKLYASDRHGFYMRVRNQCLLFHGVCHNTMLHEEPFDFMRLATGLERVLQTVRILDVKYHRMGPTTSDPETSIEAAQWLATLRSCSAIEPFLKRSVNALTGPRVADFLLFERTFPRSVLHNLERVRNFLNRIRLDAPPRIGKRSAAAIDKLCSQIGATTVERIVDGGVHSFLTSLIASADQVGSLISAEFFAPASVVETKAPSL